MYKKKVKERFNNLTENWKLWFFFSKKKEVICVHVSVRLKNYTRLSVVFWKVKRNFP